MDVELWIYDLSRGLARQLSQQLTGQYFEYIPHTSIVLDRRIELYFAGHGSGIYSVRPSQHHYGAPIEKRTLGKTELDQLTINELLESLRDVYHAGAYDLLQKNCNNFTSDFANLLGMAEKYPHDILEVPRRFHATPMGQMLMNSLAQPPAPEQQISLQSPTTNGTRVAKTATAHKLHPHRTLMLDNFKKSRDLPVIYERLPSLDKISARLAVVKDEEVIKQLLSFVRTRQDEGAEEATIPTLPDYVASARRCLEALNPADRFAFIDLHRIAAIDPRFSTWLLNDVKRIESIILSGHDWAAMSTNSLITSLQLLCNLCTSPLFKDKLNSEERLRVMLQEVVPFSLLSQMDRLRSTAANLMRNIASYNQDARFSNEADLINISDMEGIEEALVQAVVAERAESEVLGVLLRALGNILFYAPPDLSVWDLCDAMELGPALTAKKRGLRQGDAVLISDVLAMLKRRP